MFCRYGEMEFHPLAWDRRYLPIEFDIIRLRVYIPMQSLYLYCVVETMNYRLVKCYFTNTASPSSIWNMWLTIQCELALTFPYTLDLYLANDCNPGSVPILPSGLEVINGELTDLPDIFHHELDSTRRQVQVSHVKSVIDQLDSAHRIGSNAWRADLAARLLTESFPSK